MRSPEKAVCEEYVKKGYKSLNSGSPDFVFYKEKDGNISDVIFVEVKNGKDFLSDKQILYSKILKSLGLKYKLIKKNITPESKKESKKIIQQDRRAVFTGIKTTIFKTGGSTVIKIPRGIINDSAFPFDVNKPLYFEIIDESSVIIRKLKKGE